MITILKGITLGLTVSCAFLLSFCFGVLVHRFCGKNLLEVLHERFFAE